MSEKSINLYFFECDARVEVSYQFGEYALSIVSLEVDEEKSSNDTTHYKTKSETNIYLGEDEVKELIKTLNFMLVEDDE